MYERWGDNNVVVDATQEGTRGSARPEKFHLRSFAGDYHFSLR
jgi:hypothetical protein